jgi:hypothetical protein
MPRVPAALIALTAAAPAMAHTGHIGTLAGHDHWIAGAAIGAGIAIALWGLLKGRSGTGDAAPEAEPEAEDDAQEA